MLIVKDKRQDNLVSLSSLLKGTLFTTDVKDAIYMRVKVINASEGHRLPVVNVVNGDAIDMMDDTLVKVIAAELHILS